MGKKSAIVYLKSEINLFCVLPSDEGVRRGVPCALNLVPSTLNLIPLTSYFLLPTLPSPIKPYLCRLL
jgi:hypothetical protein